MLKMFTKVLYSKRISSRYHNTFYDLYKWQCGLLPMLEFIHALLLNFVFSVVAIFILKSNQKALIVIFAAYSVFFTLYAYVKIAQSLQLHFFELTNPQLQEKHLQVEKVESFLLNILATNGKALGKKEWKLIKETDPNLYCKLLSDKTVTFCSYYSSRIAETIPDSILLWGAIKIPLEKKHVYIARALILRNDYIYDPVMHQSLNAEEYIKLHKFMLYKKWKYDIYSQLGFRIFEEGDFRNWCEHNYVNYENF